VADRFLAIWKAISGSEYHPWAEVVMLIDALDWGTRQTHTTIGTRPRNSLGRAPIRARRLIRRDEDQAPPRATPCPKTLDPVASNGCPGTPAARRLFA
jgi:hypothetical protein